jgi:hypothetical protein
MMGEMIFNTTLIAVLSRATAYRPDAMGFMKLTVAALIAFGMAQQIGMPKLNWPGFIVMASLACSLYLLVSYFIKPFYMEERDRLNRLLKRRIFIW